MPDQWMSIVEYARTFAISDMTVRRRIKNGKLDAVLRDGKYFIRMNDAPSAMAAAAGSVNSMNEPSPLPEVKPLQAREAKGAVLSPRGWNTDNYDSKDLVPKSSPANTEYDLKGLVDYCNRSLHRIASIERHLNDTYQQKLGRLEAEIRAKNLEIGQLRQKVEDLQILVKMYDKTS